MMVVRGINRGGVDTKYVKTCRIQQIHKGARMTRLVGEAVVYYSKVSHKKLFDMLASRFNLLAFKKHSGVTLVG